MSSLKFNGTPTDYVEVADNAGFSVATTNSLSVSAWMRPDVLTFPNSESTGYVHWMGKGQDGQDEWTFRMYMALCLCGWLPAISKASSAARSEGLRIWNRVLSTAEVQMVLLITIPQD